MPNLVVLEGPDTGKQFPLVAGIATLGRDKANHVCLNDSEISRKHAEIHVTADGARLVDLGSANGTRLNQRDVKDAFLQAGDRLQIGRSLLQFRAESGTPADSLLTQIVKRFPGSEASRFFRGPRPDVAAPPKTRLEKLAVMYDSSSAMSRIVDLDELLQYLMELIFRAIEAEQGCIMLRGEAGHFQAKAVRRRSGEEIVGDAVFSRTIAEYVLKENQGILLADAGRDARFLEGESISRFGLREVICVPMTGRHETIGVLFLDTLSSPMPGQSGKFSDDDLELAVALGHQAAIAVEDTRYRQAMLQNERLAGIGQTIAAISHHVKNIMQGIVFGSDMVRSALKDDDKTMLTQGWRLVEKNQKKIHDLVLDMLSYSKPREPFLEPTDPNMICADVVELLRGRAAQLKAELIFEPAVDLGSIPLDADGIHKALLNIAGNALDAVEESRNPRVVISTLKWDEDWIVIRVRDNGPGIPASQVSEILKPFVSTKGSHGTGLGLPISKKILQEHSGDLIIESQEGEGSTFMLKLPRV